MEMLPIQRSFDGLSAHPVATKLRESESRVAKSNENDYHSHYNILCMRFNLFWVANLANDYP